MLEVYEKGKLIWVAPGAVRYNSEHIWLLLPWLYEMREGVYPVEPAGGYTEGKRPGIGHRAPYETICQVAAEIDRRLAVTGLDRYLVEDVFCLGLTPSELASKLHMEEREINRRIRSAVGYIASGPCPRWLHCIDCPRYQQCLRKKRVGVSYRDWVRNRRPQWLKSKIPQLLSNT